MTHAVNINFVTNWSIQMAISVQRAARRSSMPKAIAHIAKPSTPKTAHLFIGVKSAPTKPTSLPISTDTMPSVIFGGVHRISHVAASPHQTRRKLLITGTLPPHQPLRSRNMSNLLLDSPQTLNRVFLKRKTNSLLRKKGFSEQPELDVMSTKFLLRLKLTY